MVYERRERNGGGGPGERGCQCQPSSKRDGRTDNLVSRLHIFFPVPSAVKRGADCSFPCPPPYNSQCGEAGRRTNKLCRNLMGGREEDGRERRGRRTRKRWEEEMEVARSRWQDFLCENWKGDKCMGRKTGLSPFLEDVISAFLNMRTED